VWKFDTETQATTVTNAIRVSSGPDSTRLAFGIVITPDKVFVGQGGLNNYYIIHRIYFYFNYAISLSQEIYHVFKDRN